MDTAAIEAILDSYFTHLSAMQPGDWIEVFAEDAVLRDPVGKPPSLARDEYERFFGFLQKYYQSLQVERLETFVAGGDAAVKWRMSVVAQSGKQAATEGISIFEFNEAGKIQQVSSYWDEAGMVAQLRG